MLDESGLDGLTLRAIARQAGVSHGAPRNHFPTLGSLLAAVAASGFRDLIASVDRHVGALDDHAGARERLAASGRGYVDFAVTNPGVFSVMFRPERLDRSDPAYQEAAIASFGQLAGLVAEAQAAGYQPDVDTTQLASVVWSTVHGLAALWIDGGGSMPGACDGAGLDHFVALSQSIVFGPDLAPIATPGGTTP
jgi:AcrR family transcriptional regulator